VVTARDWVRALVLSSIGAARHSQIAPPLQVADAHGKNGWWHKNEKMRSKTANFRVM
jgi:hypothetical protein